MIDIVITTMHARNKDGKEHLQILLDSLDRFSFGGMAQTHIVENVSPYASAVNRGLDMCTGDVLLLNDDIIFMDGWHKCITEGVGDIRGFKLLYDPGFVIQHAGGCIARDFTTRHVGQHCWDLGQFQIISIMPYVTFGAVFIKKEVLDKVGRLSQFSKIFFEDVDYCIRAWEAGFTVFYNPISLIHNEAATMGFNTQGCFDTAHSGFYEKWAKKETINMLTEAMMKARCELAKSAKRK
jgi:hypothetical protein